MVCVITAQGVLRCPGKGAGREHFEEDDTTIETTDAAVTLVGTDRPARGFRHPVFTDLTFYQGDSADNKTKMVCRQVGSDRRNLLCSSSKNTWGNGFYHDPKGELSDMRNADSWCYRADTVDNQPDGPGNRNIVCDNRTMATRLTPGLAPADPNFIKMTAVKFDQPYYLVSKNVREDSSGGHGAFETCPDLFEAIAGDNYRNAASTLRMNMANPAQPLIECTTDRNVYNARVNALMAFRTAYLAKTPLSAAMPKAMRLASVCPDNSAECVACSTDDSDAACKAKVKRCWANTLCVPYGQSQISKIDIAWPGNLYEPNMSRRYPFKAIRFRKAANAPMASLFMMDDKGTPVGGTTQLAAINDPAVRTFHPVKIEVLGTTVDSSGARVLSGAPAQKLVASRPPADSSKPAPLLSRSRVESADYVPAANESDVYYVVFLAHWRYSGAWRGDTSRAGSHQPCCGPAGEAPQFQVPQADPQVYTDSVFCDAGGYFIYDRFGYSLLDPRAVFTLFYPGPGVAVDADTTLRSGPGGIAAGDRAKPGFNSKVTARRGSSTWTYSAR